MKHCCIWEEMKNNIWLRKRYVLVCRQSESVNIVWQINIVAVYIFESRQTCMLEGLLREFEGITKYKLFSTVLYVRIVFGSAVTMI